MYKSTTNLKLEKKYKKWNVPISKEAPKFVKRIDKLKSTKKVNKLPKIQKAVRRFKKYQKV